MFATEPGGQVRAVRSVVAVVLVGIAIGAIVFLATGGRVIFLPLVFLPFVMFWPGGRNRRFR